MCSYCIVIDRRHAGDIVTSIGGNKLCDEGFAKFVQNSAPEEIETKIISSCHSDASPISEYLPSVNISCGYYSPHGKCEYVAVNDVENTMGWVKNMITSGYM